MSAPVSESSKLGRRKGGRVRDRETRKSHCRVEETFLKPQRNMDQAGISCHTFSIGADQMTRRTICSLVGIKGTHVSHLVQTGWRRIEIFISLGLQPGGLRSSQDG